MPDDALVGTVHDVKISPRALRLLIGALLLLQILLLLAAAIRALNIPPILGGLAFGQEEGDMLEPRRETTIISQVRVNTDRIHRMQAQLDLMQDRLDTIGKLLVGALVAALGNLVIFIFTHRNGKKE